MFGFYLLLFVFISLSESSNSTGIGIGLVVIWLLYMVYALGIFIPSLAVAVRRLHDIGKSGLWLFLNFVPFGWLVILVFLCMESRPDLYSPEWS